MSSEEIEVTNYNECFKAIDAATVFLLSDSNWERLSEFQQSIIACKAMCLSNTASGRLMNTHSPTPIPIARIEGTRG
jgi:hypothetical protein